ncbi:LysR family transcriptional regulator [Lonsdalea populi]|uniref:LysR family transcriptional regulator n=1 Tax=Lonsdalea populi TaxID=1172565 RepID=A0A3N0U9H3_9GAMM|nr:MULTISPECIES: LysR substrate-binding domain-containing protein [Lonsdalea]RAT14264.1 LysR family transcriptional regulator [Lonsdalea quercina]RAT26000.1 LysR family transcriptional regulator [Lonsdalea populi]RAT37436.1 LysR family transcriptional regulator [Lonsdalea populi]RAT45744.1 LysR family transcriptional regulator [Lonsdalea populi]RAT51235.1 LysR family transcriptional regulator [Lonsdalea populi]
MSVSDSTESFRGIVHFVAAANAQSFTEAAEQLGITKSAIGKSISRLERSLGTPLFHRTTRKVSLTTEGETYLASCQSALDILQSAEKALRSKLTEPSGMVRIDMPAAFGRSVMLPVLLDMCRRYPHLKLTLTFNDKIIDPLDMGFDLAIRFGPLKDSTDLIARRLNEQRLILCASPSYLAQNGLPRSLDELKRQRCIMAWRGGKPLGWLIKGNDGKDVKFNPSPFHQISDGDAMIEACVAGAGIVQFPESLLRPYIETGKLVKFLPELTPSATELNVIWPRSRHLLPGVRFIIDELVRLSAKNAFS